MSLSSPDSMAGNKLRLRAMSRRLPPVLGVLGVLSTGSTFAAQVYYQPELELSTETNSNVDMSRVPSDRGFVEGYFANVGSVVGIATQRSDTYLFPRLHYENYSSRSDLNRLDAILDLTNIYRWERSTLSTYARYDHLSELNAELPSAEFNPTDPNAPAPADTGRVLTRATRDTFVLDPTYTYKLTQRSTLGLQAQYLGINYSPDDNSGHVDFDYSLGKAFVGWALNQKANLTVGAFGSHYSAKNIDSVSNSYGLSSDLNYNWTETFHNTFSLAYQRTDIDNVTPNRFKEKDNSWSAQYTATYETQTDKFRGTLGRSIVPGGAGGLYTVDQLRFQYDHNFNVRLSMEAAARLFRNAGLSGNAGNTNRKYATTNVWLKWRASRTWFVRVGYNFTWQKYSTDPNGADNNSVLLAVGYEGLGEQHR